MYQHGKRTRLPKNKTVIPVTIAIIGAVFLIGWYIVHKDIGNTTNPKTNVPIITEVSEVEAGEVLQIDEALFTMELPSDWKQQEERNDENSHFFIWVATKKGADDRRLTLHIDKMPQNYKLVKMWPITPNGYDFSLGNLSDDCSNFANGAITTQQNQSTAPVPAKWENVSFTCDPIKANQTIGTGTPGATIGTKAGKHTYFFYYEDHNIHPDDSILRGVLTSFKAK